METVTQNEDMMSEIFSHVDDLKTLMSFNKVSKLWKSISDDSVRKIKKSTKDVLVESILDTGSTSYDKLRSLRKNQLFSRVQDMNVQIKYILEIQKQREEMMSEYLKPKYNVGDKIFVRPRKDKVEKGIIVAVNKNSYRIELFERLFPFTKSFHFKRVFGKHN